VGNVVRGGGGEERNTYRVWLGHLKERPLGRNSHRWEDNIKSRASWNRVEGVCAE
jgi:hypothetical protein